MYNQDGRQAIARPYLDGVPAPGAPGQSLFKENHGGKGRRRKRGAAGLVRMMKEANFP